MRERKKRKKEKRKQISVYAQENTELQNQISEGKFPMEGRGKDM